MYTLTCEWCDKEFQAAKLKSKGKPRRFCGTSCSAKWRMSRPEFVATLNTEKRSQKARENMLKLRQRQDVQEKLHNHLHSDSNPFRKEEVRTKAMIALREKGYIHLNGGNGRPQSIPQRLLAARLGWPTEVVVLTKKWQKTEDHYPTHYKIDVAQPILKIGIEVQGEGHNCKKIEEKDAKKKEFLESIGWTMLEFKNKEILDDLELVVKKVMKEVLHD